MKPPTAENETRPRAASAAPRLEDLIPIAVVVAAGCEDCTQRLVKRALERGAANLLVERTLAIVAGLRSRDCFARAVGPEVIANMAAALKTGEEALDMADAAGPGCCLE